LDQIFSCDGRIVTSQWTRTNPHPIAANLSPDTSSGKSGVVVICGGLALISNFVRRGCGVLSLNRRERDWRRRERGHQRGRLDRRQRFVVAHRRERAVGHAAPQISFVVFCYVKNRNFEHPRRPPQSARSSSETHYEHRFHWHWQIHSKLHDRLKSSHLRSIPGRVDHFDHLQIHLFRGALKHGPGLCQILCFPINNNEVPVWRPVKKAVFCNDSLFTHAELSFLHSTRNLLRDLSPLLLSSFRTCEGHALSFFQEDNSLVP